MSRKHNHNHHTTNNNNEGMELQKNLQELTSMGYTSNQAKQALQVSHGDLGQAVSFLLMGDSSRMGFCFDPSSLATTEDGGGTAGGYLQSPVTVRSLVVKPKFKRNSSDDDDDDDDAMARRLEEQLSFPSLVGDDDLNDRFPPPPPSSNHKLKPPPPNHHHNNHDDENAATTSTTTTTTTHSIQSLVQMGYNATDAEIALSDCGGDIHQAIERLLMQGSVRFSGIFSASSPLVPAKKSSSSTTTAARSRNGAAMAPHLLLLHQEQEQEQEYDDCLLDTAEALQIDSEDAALAMALQEQEILEQEIQVAQLQKLQHLQLQKQTLGCEEDELLAMALQQQQQQQQQDQHYYHHAASTAALQLQPQQPQPPIRRVSSSLQPVAGNPNLPRMVAASTSIFSVSVPEPLLESISVFCAIVAASKFYQGGMVNSDFLNAILTEGIAFGNRIVGGGGAGVSRGVTTQSQQGDYDTAWSVARVLSTMATTTTTTTTTTRTTSSSNNTTTSPWGSVAMMTMVIHAAVEENPKSGIFLPSDLNHGHGLRKALATCRNEQEGTQWQIVILEITITTATTTTTTDTTAIRDCVTICLPPKGTLNKFWCLDIQPRPCFRAPPGAYARAHTNMMQLVESLEGILKSVCRRPRGGDITTTNNNHDLQQQRRQLDDIFGGDGDIQELPFSLYSLQKVVVDKRKKPPASTSSTVPPIALRGVLC
jgi:hypothetical protein